ncbi:hypothetical protein LEMLEM_LOCUS7985 [Lemmus lemmus]
MNSLEQQTQACPGLSLVLCMHSMTFRSQCKEWCCSYLGWVFALH